MLVDSGQREWPYDTNILPRIRYTKFYIKSVIMRGKAKAEKPKHYAHLIRGE